MRRFGVLSVLGFLVCFCFGACSNSQSDARRLAKQEATQWLSIVDSGKYDESWTEAGVVLQSNINEAKWHQALGNMHSAFGSVVSRRLTSEQYFKDPPNSPPGVYINIIYDTAFEKRSPMNETVMLELEGGRWKVTGYFIKPGSS